MSLLDMLQGFGAPNQGQSTVPQVPSPTTPLANQPVTAGALGGITADPNTPAVPGTGAGFLDSIGGFEGLASGAQSLGNLYMAFQQNQLAKDQFKFQKKAYNTNLNQQRQTYNTALEDRSRARAAVENRSQASADQYVAENRL